VADPILYDDGLVMLDGEGITLRRYYFPFGTSKQIPYRQIRRVVVRPMGWLTGKGRGWGTAHPGYWFPLDMQRARKDTLIVLDIGGYVKPAFSPEEPDRVLDLLRDRTSTG
jgi:hypothetical protein